MENTCLEMNKKGAYGTGIDIIAGIVLIIAGIITANGQANLGAVLAGIGLLIEAIKIMLLQGW